MMQIRRSNERGHAQHGWLESRHTFSFADYYDPSHMGFRSLRVINEDWIAPGRGFGSHPHRDMEIFTYVLSGSLAHKDSMGHEEKLGPNEVQRMSAGTGVVHSEYNGSQTEQTHLLQIWIEPAVRGVKPSYEQFAYDPADKAGKWKLLASPAGGDGVARINQDARILASLIESSGKIEYEFEPKRHAWLHIISGNVTVNGTALEAGDAAAFSGETRLAVEANSSSEVLLFDLA